MPYSAIDPNELILRDHLARDRTVLANERTLLAYVRTALALLAGGGTLLKVFAADAGLVLLGAVLVAAGVGTLAIGIWRFVTMARRLHRIRPRPTG